MKTTLDLPDELLREMKLRAVIQGRTLRDLVADFIRQGLGLPVSTPTPVAPGSSMVVLGASGLPVIRCSADAPATHMSAQDLLKLEQQTQTDQDIGHASSAV